MQKSEKGKIPFFQNLRIYAQNNPKIVFLYLTKILPIDMYVFLLKMKDGIAVYRSAKIAFWVKYGSQVMVQKAISQSDRSIVQI